MIVLDTNVLSEVLRATPAPAVRTWMEAQATATLFTTTITQAEMSFGVAILAPGKRQVSITSAVAAMFEVEFAGRVLPFDGPAALAYARIAADRGLAGRPISQLDAQIAAIAHSRGAAIATRNTADFEGCGIEVVNPWHA